jgi:nardilysin
VSKKKAGASLCVQVGSFSDPEVMPGLAHYLEHMLFMVSE